MGNDRQVKSKERVKNGALINTSNPYLTSVLPQLLSDKTTKENILWATDSYTGFEVNSQIHISDVALIQPRVQKAVSDQADRTKAQGEVFTPSWLCNKMNNFLDEDWFGKKNTFNFEDGTKWTTNEKHVEFPKEKTWNDYVLSRRLEITCGEAPFIVSRYDASTGERIPVGQRIGILDRKLRVVNENAENNDQWLEWAVKAFQSTYGYEFQGDNLFVARVNLFMTFFDYCENRIEPKPDVIKKLANIIAWNFWQMDGLTGTIPFSGEEDEQMELFAFDTKRKAVPCKIWDWRAGNAIMYNSIRRDKE